MVRKSERHSGVGTPASKHKRVVSSSSQSAQPIKKPRSSRATNKSKYFEDSDSAADADEQTDDGHTSSDNSDDGSEFGGNDDDDSASLVDATEDDSDDASDEEPKSAKKSRLAKGARSSGGSTGTSELWKPGVKTGLGPGKQVIIKKPKARAAGATAYTDDTLHPNTLLFLSDLKKNNNREWLKLNDADFRASEKDWLSFVEKMTERLIEADDTIPELPVKDVIFRIYRDVRFSKDPTPYKPYFSVAWSRAGRKGPFSHYYVQIGPQTSFIGGGLWHPEAAPMAALRRDIDRNSRRIKEALSDQKIRKEFLKGAPKVDGQVVKAFVASNAENALKTKPKGFDADHPDIDLLRLRNYTIGRKLTDDEVLGTAGAERIAYLLGCLQPFITYLNSVVMPDDAQESEDEDQESDESAESVEDE